MAKIRSDGEECCDKLTTLQVPQLIELVREEQARADLNFAAYKRVRAEWSDLREAMALLVNEAKAVHSASRSSIPWTMLYDLRIAWEKCESLLLNHPTRLEFQICSVCGRAVSNKDLETRRFNVGRCECGGAVRPLHPEDKHGD